MANKNLIEAINEVVMSVNKSVLKQVFFLVFAVLVLGCANEEKIQNRDIFETGTVESTDPLDVYLKEEFRDPYDCVVYYKFVDRYIEPDRVAVPPIKSAVEPVMELVKAAWIAPYNLGADIGDEFMKRYFPGEIVLIGSPLYNGDGTITLGTADNGVRVTLTQVNSYGPQNTDWIVQTFRTLHHEFAHIIDQNFNFDSESFFEISGDDYTSPGSWTAETIETAIARGMVTPYGTSQVGEDFAEIISYIITTDPVVFEATYITPEVCAGDDQACIDRNIGRARIKMKYDRVVSYFQDDVGVDLLKVRDEFLSNL